MDQHGPPITDTTESLALEQGKKKKGERGNPQKTPKKEE
jgi:hypothetical protein